MEPELWVGAESCAAGADGSGRCLQTDRGDPVTQSAHFRDTQRTESRDCKGTQAQRSQRRTHGGSGVSYEELAC